MAPYILLLTTRLVLLFGNKSPFKRAISYGQCPLWLLCALFLHTCNGYDDTYAQEAHCYELRKNCPLYPEGD